MSEGHSENRDDTNQADDETMSEHLKDEETTTSAGTGDEPSALPLPLPENVTRLPSADRGERLRILEALLFASDEPLSAETLAEHIPQGEDINALIEELQASYASRGINLVRTAGKWTFRTADDLSFLLQRFSIEQRRLSRAALETLSIIAYHQPVTRAEIEDIRGVATSKGTLDVLLETGWVKLRGRRRVPGRPITYGTTQGFLEHFGFDAIDDLPGLDELKGAGLLDGNLPPGFSIPAPDDSEDLQDDEEPLEDELTDEEVEAELDAAFEESSHPGDSEEVPDGEEGR